MLPTAQNLHASFTRQEKISLLIVSPQADDCSAVRRILQNRCWNIEYASNLEEAGKRLQQTAASVILCERDLSDGGWKDIVMGTRQMSPPPSVLVMSRQADDALWASVLSSGGYDVLPKPFDRRETIRVVGMAWRHCYAKASARVLSAETALVHAAAN